MKRKNLQTARKPKSFRMIALVLSFSVLLLACRKNDSAVKPSGTSVKSMSLADAAKINEAKQKLKEIYKSRPFTSKFSTSLNLVETKSSAKRSDESSKISGNSDYDFYRLLVQSAINSKDYECGPTEMDEYVAGRIADWTQDDFDMYNYGGGSFIVFDIAFYYQNSGTSAYFGSKGQYSNAVNRTIRDLKKFWDIPSDIFLTDAHGSTFSNSTLVATYLVDWQGFPQDIANQYAGYLKTFYGDSKYSNYTHPLLTFNAFAVPAIPSLHLPKKVVMGDGIMLAYDDLGYSDVAPQAILAHEFGHQVQFAKNVDFGSGAEGTRRTELMADACSAYFLAHKQGAALNWKRTKEFLQVFYDIGDCYFDYDGHHGTPNQRLRAAQFGYDVASDTKKKGKVMTSADFITLFDANLSSILAD